MKEDEIKAKADKLLTDCGLVVDNHVDNHVDNYNYDKTLESQPIPAGLAEALDINTIKHLVIACQNKNGLLKWGRVYLMHYLELVAIFDLKGKKEIVDGVNNLIKEIDKEVGE